MSPADRTAIEANHATQAAQLNDPRRMEPDYDVITRECRTCHGFGWVDNYRSGDNDMQRCGCDHGWRTVRRMPRADDEQYLNTDDRSDGQRQSDDQLAQMRD